LADRSKPINTITKRIALACIPIFLQLKIKTLGLCKSIIAATNLLRFKVDLYSLAMFGTNGLV